MQGLGDSYGIEVHHRSFNNERFSTNFQENARVWRHQQASKILESLPQSSVEKFYVTAHNKDDQLETILMKILRGTHILNVKKVCIYIFFSYSNLMF